MSLLASEFDLTRKQIAECSKEIFNRYGFAKVSMDDIAKACHKSRTTLYYYFKNKKEVFQYIAQDNFKSVLEYAIKKVNENNTIYENLTIFYKRKILKIRSNVSEFESLYVEIAKQSDYLAALFKSTITFEVNIVKEIINWAEVKGEVSALDNEELEILSAVIVSSMRTFEEEITNRNEMKNLDKRMEWMLSLICKGIS
jgi:AcrR family transcriptional regulator